MRHCLRLFAFAAVLTLPALLLSSAPARGEEDKPKGLRVFSCGHSFHVFVPNLLAAMAKDAKIEGHKVAGLSSIGGSRVIQHWDAPERAVARWDSKHTADIRFSPKSKAVVVAVRGKALNVPAPIKADTVVVAIKKPDVKIELKAKAQPKDPEGTASMFVGESDLLSKDREFEGTVSTEIDGKKVSAKFVWKNLAKEALGKGDVDVLTLSPIYLPDDGIEKLAKLAHDKNKNVRVTVQEFWLPFDIYDKTRKGRKVDRETTDLAELKKNHEAYFKDMDDHVRDLNKGLGKDVVFVVPVGQAVLALREKIIDGKAPGLKKQSELFTDDIGHVRAPVQVLNAYCHFAVIYRRSPVGLPVPAALKQAKLEDVDKLNTLLQELAWEAVTRHPLSGVKAGGKEKSKD